MPDQPIKHSDIIQGGNPFDETIKGLEKMLKLFKQLDKEVKTTAKDLLKFSQKQNIATKEGKKNIQAVAKATQQLTIKEQEALKLKKQLERQRAKLALMDTKEFKDKVKLTDAINAKNAAMRRTAKEMRTGIKTTNRWSKALGSFAFKFNALGNIMANVASVITRQLNRAIRDSVKIVVRFDKAMADTRAITGATGKEFDKLSKSARSLGGTTRFTAAEVASLQKAYAKLGFTTKEILAAQAATLDLASATNTELAEAAEVAGITIRQFGLNARETIRVTDVMARSFTTSALDMTKFKEAMKFVGPAAKASGISLERTTAILGQLADAGISGSMAGTSLRQIMLALSKESGTFSEKIARAAETGLDLAGAADEVQKRAATALLVLADGVDTIDDYTKALEDAAGASREMADIQLNTLEGQLTLVKSAWEGMILEMLAAESNITLIKDSLRGIILLLNTLSIKAETGLKLSEAFGIAKAVRDTADWAIELDKSNKALDEFLGFFEKGAIKDAFSGFGKSIWNELFPKAEGEEVVITLENIDKLIAKLKDETEFDEDDQDAVGFRWILPDSIVKKAETNLEKVLRLQDEARAEEFKAAEIARKAEEKAAAGAEELKQRKISKTFELANRLTSTFTSFFASQKDKELKAFESKQERELALVEGDAEATKRVAARLAEERAEIEAEFFRKQQVLSISQAIIDGAASILKTKRQLGLPAAIPFMIADAAITAAQIGVIASQKFGEGEVDIDGPAHSRGGINAEIEGGESVINKRSTSKYRGLLEAINANDSAAIADAALHNQAFHEVWGRTRINNTSAVNNFDPNIKKMREIMKNTPVFVPDGPRKEYYPGQNKTRIIKNG